MQKTDSTAKVYQTGQDKQPSKLIDESACEQPDVESIMARIRTQVKRGLSERPPRSPKYTPPAAELFTGSVSPVLYSDELNYLNAHWNDWSVQEEISSHREYIGPLIVKAKTLVRQFLLNSIFKTYFERERQFQMQLVRHLNAAARYVDQRDTEIFWQIVNKVDSDVKALNERVDLLFDQSSNAVSRVEFNCKQGSENIDQRVQELSHLMEGLRGDRSIKKSLLPGYAAYFCAAPGPVVDLCCSDPMFLISLRALGLSGVGLVSDQRIAVSCQSLGIESIAAQPLDYLRSLENASLGGIFAEGLITTCPEEELKEVLSTAVKKLVHEGTLVLVEKKESLRVGSDSEVVKAFLGKLGVSSEILGAKQSSESVGGLEEIELPSYAPPHLRELVERINVNIARLKQVLFEQEDVCIVGRIPG